LPRAGNSSGGGHPGWVVKCKGWETDPDAYIYVITQAQAFPALAKACGHADWVESPDFSTPEARLPRLDHVFAEIEKWTMTLTKLEVMDVLNPLNVPCGPVLSMKELAEEPSLRETGTVVEVDHPTRGKYLTVGNPIKLSDSPAEVRRSPLLGEHTEDVLRNVLGFSEAEGRGRAQPRCDLAMARILILGASYGSLFGTKLLMAGQTVALVCTRSTAELIDRDGTIVKFTVKGRTGLLDVPSRKLPGQLSASAPDDVDPAAFDLVVLGMQEAQYGAPGVRELMARVARARTPCLAIMNMPPLPYLRRIPGLDTRAVEGLFIPNPGVWEGFDPDLVTLASPDPQAFRPPDQAKNVLQVGLPTNFKAARFAGDAPTQLLRQLETGIEEARFDPGDGADGDPGQAQGPRLAVRAARQVADADHRQLSLHPGRPHDLDPGGRARRPRSLARDLRLGRHAVHRPGRRLRGPWSRSTSTPRPPRGSASHRRRRVRCSEAPRRSSASIAWSGGSLPSVG